MISKTVLGWITGLLDCISKLFFKLVLKLLIFIHQMEHEMSLFYAIETGLGIWIQPVCVCVCAE